AHARPAAEAPEHPAERLDVRAEPHEFIARAGRSENHGVVVAGPRFDIGFAQAVAKLVDGDDRLGRIPERPDKGLALRRVQPPDLGGCHREALPPERASPPRPSSPYRRSRSFLNSTSLAVSS